MGQDFVVGHGYSPMRSKLVSKICSGLFVDLVDLLQDNLKVNENEMQTFLEGKLVVTPSKKSSVEISDILSWVKAFFIHCLVLCSSYPFRWPDLVQYKLLIIDS